MFKSKVALYLNCKKITLLTRVRPGVLIGPLFLNHNYMSERKAISRKNLPVRLPIVTIAVIYLLLDKFKAPGYVWGIVGTLVVVWVILCCIALYIEKEVDIFKDNINHQ